MEELYVAFRPPKISYCKFGYQVTLYSVLITTINWPHLMNNQLAKLSFFFFFFTVFAFGTIDPSQLATQPIIYNVIYF